MNAPAMQIPMRRALALAARGQGRVEPNPMVGAVIVRPGDGAIVGEGWHERFGGRHAEVAALDDCRSHGIDPAGMTMLVTLEPCCHHGKTPPCTDALIEAKLAKVIVAMLDPFEKVAGGGVAALRQAGVEVEVGVCEAQAREINEPFLKRVATSLPWVIVKWAQTLDGKIATRTGDSQWISGEASRRRVHELRARVDAIVVGVGTIVADDPRLTAREVEVRRVARRVVVDPQRRLTGRERIFDGQAPLTIAFEARGGPAPAAPAGVELLALRQWCGQRLDLRPLLAHLAEQHGATNVLVEGGAGLVGSLLEQGLVDQILAFVAPRLMADVEALDPAAGAPCDSIAQAVRLDLRAMRRIEDDVLLDYRVQTTQPNGPHPSAIR